MKQWVIKIGCVLLVGLCILTIAYFLRARPEVVQKDTVLFTGDAPYYHLRQITYTIENFPQTLPRDPCVNFPEGSHVPWNPGTLLLYAGVCKILKAKTSHEIESVCAWIPTVLGILSVLLGFFLAKSLLGLPSAVVAAFFLAIFPLHIELSYTGHINSAIVLIFFLLAFFWLYTEGVSSEKLVFSLVYGICAGIVLGVLPCIHAPSVSFVVIPLFTYTIITLKHLWNGSWQAPLQWGHMACFGIVAMGNFYFATLAEVKHVSVYNFGYFQGWFILYCALTTVALSITSWAMLRWSVASLLKVGILIAEFILGTILLLLFVPDSGSKLWEAISSTFTPAVWSLPVRQIFYDYTWLLPFALPGFVYLVICFIQEPKTPYAISISIFLIAGISTFFSQSFAAFWGVSLLPLIALCIVFAFTSFSSRLLKASVAIIAMLLLGATFYFAPPKQQPVDIPQKELSPVLEWIGENIGKEMQGKPVRALLADPRWGDWIVYKTGVPVVANSDIARTTHFKGRKIWANFMLETEEKKAAYELIRPNIRFVLIPTHPDYKLASHILLNQESKESHISRYMVDSLASFPKKEKDEQHLSLPPSSHFRLIYSSSYSLQKPSYKIYEVVEGARLEGQTRPESSVRVTLPLETKTKKARKLVYQVTIQTDFRGFYKVQIPYSTDSHTSQIRPSAKVYDVFSAGESKVVPIMEDKVQKGAAISLHFGQ
jgi:asparagine N-glycosylation enzyme membrane subunit Stt3